MKHKAMKWMLALTMAVFLTAFPIVTRGGGDSDANAPVATSPATRAAAAAASSLDDMDLPIFHSPASESPTGEGAGARAGKGGAALPAVTVLAPDYVGRTTRAQPSFYFYISRPTKLTTRFVFTCDKGEANALVERDMKANDTSPGIKRVSLADFDAVLPQGVTYRWSIAVVDSESLTGEILVKATGYITRLADANAPSASRTDNPGDRVVSLAKQGLWYDLLDQLFHEAAAHPENSGLRQTVKKLLAAQHLELPKDA